MIILNNYISGVVIKGRVMVASPFPPKSQLTKLLSALS